MLEDLVHGYQSYIDNIFFQIYDGFVSTEQDYLTLVKDLAAGHISCDSTVMFS